MSTSIVPIFDPQGVLRDVPYEQMKDAIAAGGKPGVRFRAPDKTIRYVPADRIQDAVKAGGTLQPIEEQDVQHPGFWHAIASDLSGMAQGAINNLSKNTAERVEAMNQPALGVNDQSRQAAGNSLPYRIAAGAAERVGVNVPGMEQAATQGDVGGILGHAATVPAVLAATEGAVKGAGAVSGTSFRPAVAKVARIASDIVDPELTGIVSPRLAHAQRAAGRLADVLEKPPQTPAEVIDQHIPATAENMAASLRTKAKVEFHLSQGDVKGAEAALDQGASSVNPDYKPPESRPVERRNPESQGYTGPERRAPEEKGFLTAPAIPAENQGFDFAPPEDLGNKVRPGTEAKLGPIKRGGLKPSPDLPSMYENMGSPQPVPAVQNIRENLAMQKGAEAAPARLTPDALESHAIQQEMAQDLEKHGLRAEQEARREFIARNSTGVTKGQLIGDVAKQIQPEQDLTDEWQKALDDIRKRKQQ